MPFCSICLQLVFLFGGCWALPAFCQDASLDKAPVEMDKAQDVKTQSTSIMPPPPPPSTAESEEPDSSTSVGPVSPNDPEPEKLPPPLPVDGPPPPPEASKEQPAAQGLPAGQWVFTGQYGWVWMPFSDHFVHVPGGGGTPVMYVYYNPVGWRWVVAPWLWGCGPMPYFGVHGPLRFLWWGRGYGQWFGFSGVYGRHGWGSGIHEGGRWKYYHPHRHGRRSTPRPYFGERPDSRYRPRRFHRPAPGMPGRPKPGQSRPGGGRPGPHHPGGINPGKPGPKRPQWQRQ